jgi:hypothetical protein
MERAVVSVEFSVAVVAVEQDFLIQEAQEVLVVEAVLVHQEFVQ